LTEQQIQRCVEAWELICGTACELDCSRAARHGSRTYFDESRVRVVLGADAYPGIGPMANARMSALACLVHEFSHWERYQLRYRRPVTAPDNLIDEAETSLRASFSALLSPRDREDLVEDARDRLNDWLAAQTLVKQ
jgi:hypothetical protein